MKKVFAYILVIIFLCSVLPVREISKLCGKAQTTENVHSDDCPGDDDGLCKVKKDVDPYIYTDHTAPEAAVAYYNQKIEVAIHSASILPDHFVPNIPTPPPDFC